MSEIRTYVFPCALSGRTTGAVRKAKDAFGFSLFYHTRPFAPMSECPPNAQQPHCVPTSFCALYCHLYKCCPSLVSTICLWAARKLRANGV